MNRFDYIKKVILKDINLTGRSYISNHEITNQLALSIASDLNITWMKKNSYEPYIFIYKNEATGETK